MCLEQRALFIRELVILSKQRSELFMDLPDIVEKTRSAYLF
jgi:hypothetical protein